MKKQNEPPVDEFLAAAILSGVEVEIPEEHPEEEAGGVGADSDVYIPRLTCPAKNNKYYITVAYGGLNKCILGKPQYSEGSALANCVGYSWGRTYENLGTEPKLSRANAEDWWGYTKDGYIRSQEPRLGAIACWRKGEAGKGSDGAGHVGVVEDYDPITKKVKLSNSGYGSTVFYLTTYTVGKMSFGSYTFQGFIWTGDWPLEKDVINVDGYWGVSTTKYTQKMLGTNADGIVSGQSRFNKKYLPNCETASWKFQLFASGSAMVRALQKLVGADADGVFGRQSAIKLQEFLKAKGLYDGKIDGYVGAETVKAWQKYVNAYFRGTNGR